MWGHSLVPENCCFLNLKQNIHYILYPRVLCWFSVFMAHSRHPLTFALWISCKMLKLNPFTFVILVHDSLQHNSYSPWFNNLLAVYPLNPLKMIICIMHAPNHAFCITYNCHSIGKITFWSWLIYFVQPAEIHYSCKNTSGVNKAWPSKVESYLKVNAWTDWWKQVLISEHCQGLS